MDGGSKIPRDRVFRRMTRVDPFSRQDIGHRYLVDDSPFGDDQHMLAGLEAPSPQGEGWGEGRLHQRRRSHESPREARARVRGVTQAITRSLSFGRGSQKSFIRRCYAVAGRTAPCPVLEKRVPGCPPTTELSLAAKSIACHHRSLLRRALYDRSESLGLVGYTIKGRAHLDIEARSP